MFDCRVIKSYSHKKSEKKGRTLAYRFERTMEATGASNEEAPPCDPKSNNQTKKSGRRRFPWLLTWKPKTASKDVPSWSSPKKFGWHMETYSTIKIKIFFFCYVLLLNRELGLSISSGFFRAKKMLFTPLVFLFNFFT